MEELYSADLTAQQGEHETNGLFSVTETEKQSLMISERHRHRYEVNNDYREKLTEAGLVLSGLSPDGNLVETAELPGRSFHIGVQYHPEFKSRPNKPHPLFKGFIKAALEKNP